MHHLEVITKPLILSHWSENSTGLHILLNFMKNFKGPKEGGGKFFSEMKQKNPHSSCDYFRLRFWVGMMHFLTRPEGKSENKHKKHKKVRISGFFHPNYSPFISRWNNPLIRSPLIHPLPTSRDIQVKHLADKENDPIFEVLKGMGSLKWKVVSQTKTKM